jgi:16S rRNA (guanine527-N7)-methyltransferase
VLNETSGTSLDVSRETMERLSIYVETLKRWNQRINLIGRTTETDIWNRHIVDSAQLNKMAPDARNWVDLGSGAGLPALIIAAMRIDDEPEFSMTAVESDQRKCAFMADVARKMETPIKIVNVRIKNIATTGYDTVSARALAPLTKLLGYAAPLRTDGAICLFPKGARADRELTDAAKDWHMTCEQIPSVTDVTSVILKIRAFERVA